MYPRKFFDTYWRGSLRREVFVAMSFADEFEPIWKEAIHPAIESDLDSSAPYKAHRVNISKISDSIHSEILSGIAHATLVFADISVMQTGHWIGQRNGNVMFELGIAQTVRPATDLVVFRSDKEEIAFDINHIRINEYDRNDLPAARRRFAECLCEALRQRELEKRLMAERLRDRLDVGSMNFMVKVFREKDGLNPFCIDQNNPNEAQITMRLLDLDIIRCVTPEGGGYFYEWTDFGKHCWHHPNRA